MQFSKPCGPWSLEFETPPHEYREMQEAMSLSATARYT
jgi:hypothetical protein